MELIEHLRRQFAYDSWANREVLAALSANANTKMIKISANGRPLQLLAHILSAERLWLERLRQQPQSLPVWPNFSHEQCEAQIAEIAQLWSEYLGQLSVAQLSENVGYKNSKGEPWASTVEDVLTHVILHSAYHRGQLAMLTRDTGDTPATTDFIFASRKGLV